MMNSLSKSFRCLNLYSGLRFLITGTVLMCCICTHAQFLINGIEPKYDQRTHSFLISIPQSYWGIDYQATVSLTTNSSWQNASVEGQPIHQTIIFHNIQQNSVYSIRAFIDGDSTDYKLAFTYLPILRLTGEFGAESSLGGVHLQMPGKAQQTMKANIKWRGGTSKALERHKKNSAWISVSPQEPPMFA